MRNQFRRLESANPCWRGSSRMLPSSALTWCMRRSLVSVGDRVPRYSNLMMGTPSCAGSTSPMIAAFSPLSSNA
jgi:hypothetical protein